MLKSIILKLRCESDNIYKDVIIFLKMLFIQ